MVRAKKDPVEKVEEVRAGGEIIVLWKATRPLSTTEHEQLSEKLRAESSLSGVKIVLSPFSVDASVMKTQGLKIDPASAGKATEPIQELSQDGVATPADPTAKEQGVTGEPVADK